jgi:hypothetical protein
MLICQLCTKFQFSIKPLQLYYISKYLKLIKYAKLEKKYDFKNLLKLSKNQIYRNKIFLYEGLSLVLKKIFKTYSLAPFSQLRPHIPRKIKFQEFSLILKIKS